MIIVLLLVCGLARDADAKPTAKEYLKRGDVQLSRNKPARAIISYTKAIQLDPTLAEAYVRRGMARRAHGKLNAAIEDFERAESIDRETTSNNRHVADAYSNRGFIELNDLQIDEAIADFTKAIGHYCDPVHYHRRGQARLLEKNLEGAVEDFSEALNLNSHNDFLTSMI